MTSKLHDPTLPAGAIVEECEDGGALRNDGVKLRPANENPWYVLATVYGEQKINTIDWELHRKNAQAWNGYFCSRYAANLRREDDKPLPYHEQIPLSREQFSNIEQAFLERFANLPESGFFLDTRFENTHFKKPLVFDGFVFPMRLSFDKCTCRNDLRARNAELLHGCKFVDLDLEASMTLAGSKFSSFVGFKNVICKGPVSLKGCEFTGRVSLKGLTASGGLSMSDSTFGSVANMSGAKVSNGAYFEKCQFKGHSNFRSLNFSDDCSFQGAEFVEEVDFSSTNFGGKTDFSDGKFFSRTIFRHSVFKKQPPQFYQREMHQDTTFTLERDQWPIVTAQNAKVGKDAYTRLRVIMNDLQRPDDEHFFFRQEMRCKAAMEGGLDRWLIKAYGQVSDFGYSAVRPAAFLAGTVAIGWAAMGTYLKNWTESTNAIAEGLGLSIANTFPFLGFIRRFHSEVFKASPNWLDVIAASQSVLGIIFLFFFLLGLRTRFRLK